MAVAFVKDFSATSGSNTIVLTVPAGGIAAGNTLVLFITKDTNPDVVNSVADASGGANTYAQAGAVIPGSTDWRSFLWYSYMNVGLSAASSITVTLSAASGGACVASEFSGLTAAPLDRFVGAQLGSTTVDSGPTATTTQASELVFGCAAIQGTFAFTPSDVTYTTTEDSTFLGVWRMVAAYKVVSGTSTFSYGGTIATGTNNNAMVATFKAVPTTAQQQVALDGVGLGRW